MRPLASEDANSSLTIKRLHIGRRCIATSVGNGRGYICFYFGFGKVHVLPGNMGWQAAEFG